MIQPTTSLEVFQDLRLRGAADTRHLMRQALIDQVQTPWRHAIDREQMLRNAGADKEAMAFERDASPDIEAAGLVLMSTADGYEVVNIVPTKKSELSHRQYNAILLDFAELIAEPAAKECGFQIHTTSGRWEIEEQLPASTAKALISFSRLANKSSSASHPLDRRRWFAFIIDAHRHVSSLDASLLSRWLVEAEKWPEDVAHDLAAEYETARALLDQYDGAI